MPRPRHCNLMSVGGFPSYLADNHRVEIFSKSTNGDGGMFHPCWSFWSLILAFLCVLFVAMHCDCANQALKTKQVGSRDSSWMEGHKVIIDIGGEMTIKVNADLFTVAGDNKFSAMLSHRWREHGSSFDCNIFVDYSPMVFMPLIDSELQRVAEDIFCIILSILSLFCFRSLWSCAGCCCCVNLFCEPLCLSRHWWVSVLLQQFAFI